MLIIITVTVLRNKDKNRLKYFILLSHEYQNQLTGSEVTLCHKANQTNLIRPVSLTDKKEEIVTSKYVGITMGMLTIINKQQIIFKIYIKNSSSI